MTTIFCHQLSKFHHHILIHFHLQVLAKLQVQEPGFSPSSFNLFQQPPPPPPSPDAFPSRGRCDAPPPPAPSLSNFQNFTFGAQPSNSLGLFGSRTATITSQKENVTPKDDMSIQIDNSIYELHDQSDLELGNRFIKTLGVEANDLLDSEFIKKQEENK